MARRRALVQRRARAADVHAFELEQRRRRAAGLASYMSLYANVPDREVINAMTAEQLRALATRAGGPLARLVLSTLGDTAS